ncbi:ATP-binding cassette domain-containing protein [Ningiella sp. W23]|uniref:ATP-binding cassette domain-containing protein n=1 Tax=Ningiella sp. W23 TaxID=3023715 RepID=UPI0037569C66
MTDKSVFLSIERGGVQSVDWDLSTYIVAVSGKSGAGKTTLLKQIAGISLNKSQYSPPYADVSVNGVDLNGHSSAINPCVYVGADTPLFEHMSLYDNLKQVHRMSKWASSSSAKSQFERFGLPFREPLLLEEIIAWCELDTFIHKSCLTLSSGEKQRGQIARALASNKPILLLDEALSAMDAALRKRMQMRLKKLQRKRERAMVVVSHDARELLFMGDFFVSVENQSIHKQSENFECDTAHFETSNSLASIKVQHDFDDNIYGLSVFSVDIQPCEQNKESQIAQIFCKRIPHAKDIDKLIIDAQSVVLARAQETEQQAFQTSMLNKIDGEVAGIAEVFANDLETEQSKPQFRITLTVFGQSMDAIITAKSMDALSLSVGDKVYAMFKAL